ncbi:MAG: UDP-3-O-(3-hydroxymyristoyl)glucosamine N-acyltransferase [Myxococcota bacterium]
MTKTVAELAALVGGEVDGDGALSITGVAGLESAQPGQLSFYGNQKYRAALEATRASAVFVGEDAPSRGDRTFVRVKHPHLAFARAAQLFHPKKQHAPGVSSRAQVHPQARVDPSATVMAHATVERGAQVGARAVLYPGVYVGEDARVGDDTVLSPNVAVMDRCVVGARCLVHAGAVIGADGFGFALDLSVPEHVKIPQAGIARVEDDVEIGACTCIDRATTGETVIGRGTKIDNLVQVGHNSVVGPLSILCAQVGLSGTSTLGQGVVLAGQVGVAGHLRVGDLAKVGAQAGVMSDVDDGATVLGAPAMPHKDFLRSAALFARLPELNKELRELRKRLERLEKESAE